MTTWACANTAIPGDVHRASAKVKNAMPGSKPGLEKDLKDFGAETGAKIDKAVRPISFPFCFRLFRFFFFHM